MMKIFSNNFSISSILIVVSLSLFWGGCAPTDHSHNSSDVSTGSTQVGGSGGTVDGDTRPSGNPRDAMLEDLWLVFIKPALEDFKEKSAELKKAGNAYCESLDPVKKGVLKEAWSNAFQSYRYLAVFPFGGKWKNNPIELVSLYNALETTSSNVGAIRNVSPDAIKDIQNVNKQNSAYLGFGALDYGINKETSSAVACKIIKVNTSVIEDASNKTLYYLDTRGIYNEFKTGDRARFQSGKQQSISALAARLGQATDFLVHKLNDPIADNTLIDGYYSEDQSISLLKKMFEGINKYYRLEDGKTSFRSILHNANSGSAENIDKNIKKLEEAFGKLEGDSYENAIKQQLSVVREIVTIARALKSSFRTDLMTPLNFSTDPADSDGD